MQFNLILFEGTDTIKFGMTSEKIQSILRIKPSLSKSVVDIYDTEFYSEICKVWYEPGENDKLVCVEIEFLKPSKVFLDNIQLMGEPREKVEDLFKFKFEDFTNDDMAGPGSEKNEIWFYAPRLPRKKSIVETVAISRKGYREQQRKFYEKAYDEKYSIDKTVAREYICLNCKDVVSSKTPIVTCSKCDVFMIPH